MRNLIFTAALLCANGALAATITIDFEEPDLDVTETDFGGAAGTHITSVRSKGFQIEYVPFGDGSIIFSSGPDNMAAWGPYGSIEFSAVDQRVFDLSSVDLSTWADDQLTVTGYYALGGTVGTSMNLIGNFSPSTYTFNQNWVALDKVVFTTAGDPGIIDDIVVQAVPVPAAIWLFGSALASFGWVRRRARH